MVGLGVWGSPLARSLIVNELSGKRKESMQLWVNLLWQHLDDTDLLLKGLKELSFAGPENAEACGVVTLIAGALAIFNNVAPIQMAGCIALSKLASGPSRKLVRNGGGVRVARSAMVECPEDSGVFALACTLLGELACEGGARAIVDEGCLPLACAGLRRHAAHPEAASGGCFALAAFVKDALAAFGPASVYAALLASDALPGIVAAVRTLGGGEKATNAFVLLQYMSNDDAPEECVKAVCNSTAADVLVASLSNEHGGADKIAALTTLSALTLNDEFAKRACQAGATARMLDFIRQRAGSNEDALTAAWAVLGRMARCDGEARRFVELGGLDHLMRALETSTNVNTVGACLVALAYLSTDPDVAVVMAMRKVVSAVVAAMRRCRKTENVQTCGLHALHRFQSAAPLRAPVVAEGGVLAIASALRHCGESRNVVVASCSCLVDIARSADGQAAVMRDLDLEVLTTCILGQQWETVYHVGAAFLADMASSSPEHAEALQRAGGVRVAVEALRRCGSNAEIAQTACGALCALATTARSVPEITVAGGVALLVGVAHQHVGDKTMAMSALAALYQITQTVAVAQQREDAQEGPPLPLGAELIAAGVVPVAVELMRSFPDVGNLLSLCGSLLNTVSSHSDAGRQAVRAAGAIPVIVGMMRDHPQLVDVQVQGLVIFWQLAKTNEDNRRTIAHAGGVPVVLAAMRNHPDDPAVQHVGSLVATGFADVMIADPAAFVPLLPRQ